MSEARDGGFSNATGVVLYTADMKRSEKFYTEILGLKVVESKPSFVTLQAKNLRLYLHIAENPPKTYDAKKVKIFQVTFQIDDIDMTYRHLKQAQGNITHGIVKYNSTTFVFNFLDPDGNSLACESNKRNKP